MAGWPPIALLLAVELLAHRPAPGTHHAGNSSQFTEPTKRTRTSAPAGGRAAGMVTGSAEQRMWVYYQRKRAAGRSPTGAELDRIAGTNNYGRAVLARWRRSGRAPANAA